MEITLKENIENLKVFEKLFNKKEDSVAKSLLNRFSAVANIRMEGEELIRWADMMENNFQIRENLISKVANGELE